MPAEPGDPVPEAPFPGGEAASLDDEWVDQTEWVDDVAVAEPVIEPVADGASGHRRGEAGTGRVAGETHTEPAGAVATVSRATEPERETRAAQASRGETHTELAGPAAPVAAPAPPQERRVGIVAIAFGAAIVLLAAGIPLLTWFGYHLVVTSRAGVTRGGAGPGAGTTQVVPPTPTELVVFTDSRGRPVSYSLLSLNNGAHGGEVVSIPATTKLPIPEFGLIRLDVAFGLGGLRTLQDSLAQILDFSVGGNVRIGPAEAGALVRPLGQLTVDNPVDVDGPEGSFPSGQLQLQPSDVVNYLAATNSSDPLAQMKTQQAFWRAWLSATGDNSAGAQAAANLDARLGHFAQTMASGDVRYDTLPVTATTASGPDGGSINAFSVDQGAARRHMLAAVPFPMAPINLRPQIALYNGYDQRGVSPAIMQRVVFAGGQLLLVGTSGNLGRETTELHYGDPSMVPEVDQLRAALGAGNLVFDSSIAEPGEVTIICGKDVIAHPPAMLVGANG